MLKPLSIGNLQFPVNLIQGPLAGVSCAPFRALMSDFIPPAFAYTEMISCKTLLHQRAQTKKRYLSKDKNEGRVCYQLSGNHPLELAEAVKIVTDAGADLIDLNCGCPVKKIRSKGAGSSLLMQVNRLFQLIAAMKQHTTLPVSIKIRVQGASEERFHAELVKMIKDSGLDFLTVRGRHWREHYETPCRHEQIQYFVEELKIPVIGNGDVRDLPSLHKMLATGCAGVMIGRAGVGQPWLTAQLLAEIAGKSFSLPSPSERGRLFLRHIAQLAALMEHERFAVLEARKLFKYYARALPSRDQGMALVFKCETLADLHQICSTVFR